MGEKKAGLNKMKQPKNKDAHLFFFFLIYFFSDGELNAKFDVCIGDLRVIPWRNISSSVLNKF